MKKIKPVTGYDITFVRDKVKVVGPACLAPVVEAMGIKGLEVEHFFVLALNVSHQLIRTKLISVGTINACMVHPRECFHPLVESRAAAWVCVHNHPSGETVPSAEDLALTQRLYKNGQLMGIPLLDHLIVGDCITSLRDTHESLFTL